MDRLQKEVMKNPEKIKAWMISRYGSIKKYKYLKDLKRKVTIYRAMQRIIIDHNRDV